MMPPFDTPVPPSGYRWWYLDGLSDDGRHGITLIAFIGSVFSPYYARARRRAGPLADPLAHCALNVVLYATSGSSGPTGWAMTERTGARVQRRAEHLQIGPSALDWDGTRLRVTVNEVTAPWPRRIRGEVLVQADAWLNRCYPLDPGGLHQWQPVAPVARIEVALTHPALRWQGAAYLDANFGARPLERDFAGWHWSRAALSRRRSAVLYDVTAADGGRMALALQMDHQGRVEEFAPPPAVGLSGTRWGITRRTRADAGAAPRVAQTLEDGPFYARSVLATHLLGQPATAIHESLSLQRFSAPWVQALLPFRMPRRRA
jgi:carotenoid 1,2-hydratase